MVSLTRRTSFGVIWHLTQLLATKGITAFLTLALAYFLTPSDFGLVAMMVIFITVANALTDSGVLQALIRIKSLEIITLNTAFYTNCLLGLISYGVLFSSAPAIAIFYEREELITLIRVTGITVIINGFQIVQLALQSKSLNFKLQFKAALPASLLSAIIALLLAYYGFGVWALVAQMLASSFLFTLFLWHQNKWRPSASFSIKAFKDIYNFGYKLFLADMLDIVFRNVYVVIIAKLFSSTIAGLYYFADKITEVLILQVVSSIQRVTYPALVSLDDNAETLKAGYKKLIIVTSFLISPFVLMMAALSDPLFKAFLHEEWWPASIYLQLMCAACVLMPIHALNLNILKVKGRSDLSLWIEIIKKVMSVLILIISLSYGVIGILCGQVVASFLAYFINGYYSKELIDYGVREQAIDFLPNLGLAILVASIIFFLSKSLLLNEFSRLILLTVLGITAYLFLAKLLKLKGLSLCRTLLTQSRHQT